MLQLFASCVQLSTASLATGLIKEHCSSMTTHFRYNFMFHAHNSALLRWPRASSKNTAPRRPHIEHAHHPNLDKAPSAVSAKPETRPQAKHPKSHGLLNHGFPDEGSLAPRIFRRCRQLHHHMSTTPNEHIPLSDLQGCPILGLLPKGHPRHRCRGHTTLPSSLLLSSQPLGRDHVGTIPDVVLPLRRRTRYWRYRLEVKHPARHLIPNHKLWSVLTSSTTRQSRSANSTSR